MTYTNPGRPDNVYIGKVNGERTYMPHQYLLWSLRDLLEIVNGTNALIEDDDAPNFGDSFGEKLTFSQLYDFVKTHKQFINNKNSPHTSCLCDTCENCVLLTKGLNACKRRFPQRIPETPHDIVENYSCNSTEKSCMFDECTECSQGKVIDVDVEKSQSSSSDSDSDSDSDIEVNFYKWETPDKHVMKARISLSLKEAIATFKQSVS